MAKKAKTTRPKQQPQPVGEAEISLYDRWVPGMPIEDKNPRSTATGVRFCRARIVVELLDGRELSVPMEWFPRLVAATPGQRRDWRLMADGLGIHWNELDEDVSVDGLLNPRWGGT